MSNQSKTLEEIHAALKTLRNRPGSIRRFRVLNETGAKIADILMSIMEICILNRINPYDYLIAIQQHQTDVRKDPQSL